MNEPIKCLLWGAALGLPAMPVGILMALLHGAGEGPIGVPASILLWPVETLFWVMPGLEGRNTGAGMLVGLATIQVLGYAALVAVPRSALRAFTKRRGLEDGSAEAAGKSSVAE